MTAAAMSNPAIASAGSGLLGALSCNNGEYGPVLRLIAQLAQVVATIVDYVSAAILWVVVFVVYPSPITGEEQKQRTFSDLANGDSGSTVESRMRADQKQASRQFQLINKMCDDLLDKASDDEDGDTPPAARDPFHWSSSMRRRFLRKESVTSSVAVEGPLSPRSTAGSEAEFADWLREDPDPSEEVITTRAKSVSSISVPENAMDEMRQLFPEADEDILARFLIARRSVVVAAAELYANHVAWRQKTLPLHDGDVAKVMGTGCLYVKGRTKEDTPLLVFRGGFYDNTVAPSDHYVLAAVYLLEKMVAQGMDKVTVLVNVAALPGGVNAPPDISFIKQLASVLSDNYPERLHRLVLYPFPWIGTAVWNVVKMFIDQRTRDRIILISGKATQGAPTPAKLYEYVDADQLAPMLGGTDTSPIDPYSVKL